LARHFDRLLGLPAEGDRFFKSEGPLGTYADLARENGSITA